MSLVSSWRWSAVALIAILVLAASPVFAQSDLTSISGYVKDPTGASVPGAQITLKNEATGTERRATTNESGYYTFTNIPSATYTVTVEATVFKKTGVTGNKLDPNVPATVDVTVAVGQTSESIEVTADAVAIQSESATLGRVVSETQIKNLQLNGRNPLFLALLKPGVNGGALSQFSYSLT